MSSILLGWFGFDVRLCGALLALVLLGLWVGRFRGRRTGVPGPRPNPPGSPELSLGDSGRGVPGRGDSLNPRERTAVFLVDSEDELGVLALISLHYLFPEGFRQIVFVSAGILDYRVMEAGAGGDGTFWGELEVKRLGDSTRQRLRHYVARAREFGWTAGYRISVGTCLADECEQLCTELAQEYPKVLFFLGKLVFSRKRWYHRLMHQQMADTLQGRLEKKGLPVTVIPVVLPS